MTTTTTKGHNMATTGSKYNSGTDITEIAKAVRKDLKAAMKAGDLPAGCKFSVRIDRYSMGQSLDVSVKAVPAGFEINNPHRTWLDNDDPHFAYHTLAINDPRYARLSPEAAELIATVEALVNAYNRKDIDSMTDYYNVNFSEHVGFDCALTEADRNRQLAEPRPELPAPADLDDEQKVGKNWISKPAAKPEADAPSCPVVKLDDARAKGAQAALKAADQAEAPAVTAEPAAALAPAQAPEVTFQTAPRVDASEYSQAQLEAAAQAVAGAAGVELASWSIRVRSNGRISLVVKGTRSTTVDGLELVVDATASLAL
jgi:hypothetical protein